MKYTSTGQTRATLVTALTMELMIGSDKVIQKEEEVLSFALLCYTR